MVGKGHINYYEPSPFYSESTSGSTNDSVYFPSINRVPPPIPISLPYYNMVAPSIPDSLPYYNMVAPGVPASLPYGLKGGAPEKRVVISEQNHYVPAKRSVYTSPANVVPVRDGQYISARGATDISSLVFDYEDEKMMPKRERDMLAEEFNSPSRRKRISDPYNPKRRVTEALKKMRKNPPPRPPPRGWRPVGPPMKLPVRQYGKGAVLSIVHHVKMAIKVLKSVYQVVDRARVWKLSHGELNSISVLLNRCRHILSPFVFDPLITVIDKELKKIRAAIYDLAKYNQSIDGQGITDLVAAPYKLLEAILLK